jgi:hypothetical protein
VGWLIVRPLFDKDKLSGQVLLLGELKGYFEIGECEEYLGGLVHWRINVVDW